MVASLFRNGGCRNRGGGDDTGNAAAIKGNIVFVAGATQAAFGELPDWAVRALSLHK